MLYAMSDIHGCQIAFARRIAQLEAHGFFEEGSTDTLVLLGDYIDNGPDGLGVTRTIMAMQQWTNGRVIALMGNHENEFLYWVGADEANHVVLDERDGALPQIYAEDESNPDEEELFSFRGLPRRIPKRRRSFPGSSCPGWTSKETPASSSVTGRSS